MAYGSYYPAGYQPMMYQPQIQQASQMSQQPQANSGIIWVQGEAAAKSYPIAPNTSVPLWDSEANVIYIKSADQSGMPSIKILDYTMRTDTAKKNEISHESDFATKNDVDYLKGEISTLKTKIERLTSTGRKEKSNGK